MPTRQHSLDRLVDEVAEYIESMSDFLADAMLEDGVAPFEAHITDAQRFAYFNELLWNPDGTPNQQGRQHLVDTQGLDEYVRTFRWVETRRNRELRGVSKREGPRRRAAESDSGESEDEDY